jgi:hypothetical protein
MFKDSGSVSSHLNPCFQFPSFLFCLVFSSCQCSGSVGSITFTGLPDTLLCAYSGSWNRVLQSTSKNVYLCQNFKKHAGFYFCFQSSILDLKYSSDGIRFAVAVLRIRIRDPGSGAFLTPGSGIPDPKTIFLRA